ncbi:ABC transporter substrate-binding protein [Streptomyces sp. WAC 00631]|uniref:ABC transporter substrate-binding protein n=1 Tax=unclassified Streptomyces TaxID=2593676 RepID=UPI000F77808A|nr:MULTISPECIES: ABC transporter substrate-binding protein [unclassified Streptomyces]MCC5034175.1 ABC transporter substrate-binding protein [Streptomyces sp. WAC 00631]MCC9742442.1 ABC transporter substrate-binding protein [Streptomyces sp. MNU89]
MNRKTLAPPAAIGLLVPVLAACGATGGSAADGAIVVGTTEQFVLTKDNPAPFDPALAYEMASWNVLRNTFQTLMALPRSGSEPVPEAATKCGFSDRRNEQYRCTLREGLKFSNDNLLTAEDVKFSVERTLGIEDPNGPVSLISNIDRIETLGDLEVVFHLKKPDATFPYKLATPAAAIVDSQSYKRDALRDGFEVSGSGPYTLETKEKDGSVQSLVFTRNRNYQGQVELRNDKVELRILRDSTAMEKALKAGEIDLMTRSMSPEQIARLAKGEDKDIELVEMPGQEIRYLVFDTEHPVAGRKAVRRAVAQIVDRQELARDVYARSAQPLYSMIPSSVDAHLNSFFNRYGEPDADAARRTLASAGVETPVKLELTYTTDHYGPATAMEFESLQKQLNRTGLFDVTIKGVPWKTFRPSQTEGEYAVYGMGWFPDFPDPDNFTAPFFSEDNFLNSPYDNKEIHSQLIPETRQQAERTGATKSFEEIQDIVAEDVPLLPLWQGKQYVAARNTVTGVEWALNSSSVLQLWELGRTVG